MAKEKPHVNLVFIGHVDHGKSTTVGRLCFDTGNVDEQAMRKLKDKASELGKSGFEFAYVMDNLKEEQERGVTIDLSHRKFVTDKYDFTIIDAPGHQDFIKNMITGASQADAAVLTVAANDGINAQTREHVFLSRTLGIKQMIVNVNKMDLQDFKEERFNAVKEEVTKLLKSVGFDTSKIPFVPASSLNGFNIATKDTEKMPWYTGPTLLDCINAIDEPERPVDLPLRMPIQEVYNIKGIGVVPVGKIQTGVMKVGQKIIATPAREGRGKLGEVKSIEMHHEMVQEAIPGDNVGVNVRGIEKKDIARGDVIGAASDAPTVAEEFRAQILVLAHPSVITIGYTPVFHIHTSQIACRFEQLIKRLNGDMADNPDFLKNGDSAMVLLKPVTPVVIEPQKEIPDMSRFAIRDSGKTVAAGLCIEVTKKKPMGA